MNPSQAAEYIADLDKAVEELRSGKLGEILPPQRIDDRLRKPPTLHETFHARGVRTEAIDTPDGIIIRHTWPD